MVHWRHYGFHMKSVICILYYNIIRANGIISLRLCELWGFVKLVIFWIGSFSKSTHKFIWLISIRNLKISVLFSNGCYHQNICFSYFNKTFGLSFNSPFLCFHILLFLYGFGKIVITDSLWFRKECILCQRIQKVLCLQYNLVDDKKVYKQYVFFKRISFFLAFSIF